MAVRNRSLRYAILAVVFIFLYPLLWAQNNNTINSFLQRLEWIGDDNSFRYEVIIEEETGEGVYRALLRDFSLTNSIEVSLSPGRYRYRVIPHDFLDRPGSSSAWVVFEVRRALDSDRIFIHRLAWVGDEYAQYYSIEIERETRGRYRGLLRELTTGTFIEISLMAGNYRYRVTVYDYLNRPGGSSAWMYITVRPESDLLPVTEMVAEAKPEMMPEIVPEPEPEPQPVPEPVPEIEPEPEPEPEPEQEPEIEPEVESEPEITPEPEFKEEKIEYRKRFNLFAGAAWMPLFRYYGIHDFYFENYSLYGAAIRLDIVSGKQSIINPGLNLAFSWYGLDSVHIFTFDMGFIAHKLLPNEKTAFNLRLGAGVSIVPMTNDSFRSSKEIYSINANMGLSFLWLFWKNAYTEIGFDYTHVFTGGDSGYIRPWIGIGYKF